VSDERKPILLAILAHPDDESFGLGGTLACYARRSHAVHLICATRGEAGDVKKEYLQGFNSIASLRMKELECAAAVLGLTEIHYLDYRDSGMLNSPDNQHPQALMNAPINQVALDLVVLIRKIRPDIILTHDPIGTYGHPDHIAIQQAAVLSFFLAGVKEVLPEEGEPFSPQKLYFHTLPRKALKIMVKFMPLLGMNPRQFGNNKDINLEEIASVQFPIHTRIHYGKACAELRNRAAMCHASQGGAQQAYGLMAKVRQYLASHTDDYMQAFPMAQSGTRHTEF